VRELGETVEKETVETTSLYRLRRDCRICFVYFRDVKGNRYNLVEAPSVRVNGPCGCG
jgi:hypothetical protein